MSRASHGLKKLVWSWEENHHLLSFADCDIDNAVSAAIMANFYTQGRDLLKWYSSFCQSKLREVFIEKLLKRVKKLTRLVTPCILQTCRKR